MGFWSDLLRSANPFAGEDLSSPQAREKKAWKAAGAMYWLNKVMPFERSDISIALSTARSRIQKDPAHREAWNKKLFYLNKLKHQFDIEIRHAYRDQGNMPPDIKTRAQYLYVHEQGQLAQQRPQRHWDKYGWSLQGLQ